MKEIRFAMKASLPRGCGVLLVSFWFGVGVLGAQRQLFLEPAVFLTTIRSQILQTQHHPYERFPERLNLRWAGHWQGMDEVLTYDRVYAFGPHQSVVVTETWSFPPQDVLIFFAKWGVSDADLHELRPLLDDQDLHAWQDRLGSTTEDTWFRCPRRGVLERVRVTPTLALATQLDVFQPPMMLQPPESSPGKEPSRLDRFVVDVLNEEFEDRDGFQWPVSLSFDFREGYSKAKGFARLERNIRRDYAGNFVVFDRFSVGGRFLLGSVKEEDRYREIGPAIHAKQGITVVQSGFPTWWEALLSKPYLPPLPPFEPDEIRSIPIGMQISYPQEAQLVLGWEEGERSDSLDPLPWQMLGALRVGGHFQIALKRLDGEHLRVSVGGRLERFVDLESKSRLDFRGIFDWRRLLVGSFVKLRFQKGSGLRLFLESVLPLEQPAQWDTSLAALNQGFRWSTLSMGIRVGWRFVWDRQQQEVTESLKSLLPEVPWQHSLFGDYSTRSLYGKVGIRPWSLRGEHLFLKDHWRMEDLQQKRMLAGDAYYDHYRRSYRRPGRLAKFELKGQYLQTPAATPFMLQWSSWWEDEDWENSAFQEWRASLVSLPMLIPHRERLGFGSFLSLNPQGWRLLQQSLVQTQDEGFLEWRKGHPWLYRRFCRDVRKERQAKAFRTFSKMLRKQAPVSRLLATLPEETFFFQARIQSGHQSLWQQQRGTYSDQLENWQAWDRWMDYNAVDEPFVEQTLSDLSQR
jgi:hypothetical protein